MAHAPAESAYGRVSWDDVRLLLHVARSRSFRAAADSAHVSPNTLRRRLSGLEVEIGHILLARGAKGVSLTPKGIEVAQIAMRMSGQVADLERMAHERRRAVAGTVRVAATDRLGLGWIAPHLIKLGQEHPAMTIDLLSGVRFFDRLSQEADIWIQLERPTVPDLVAARLGFLHLELFASDEYIQSHGVPSSVDDLARFQVVEHISEEVPLLSDIVPNPENRRFVSVRVNTSAAHAHAIAHGAGIGLLPTYTSTRVPRLRPIHCDFHVRREIWMAYHASVRQMKHVRAAIDWLKDGFDPARHPWFRETYIPAAELETGPRDDRSPPSRHPAEKSAWR